LFFILRIHFLKMSSNDAVDAAFEEIDANQDGV
jgi:hypothetical protein